MTPPAATKRAGIAYQERFGSLDARRSASDLRCKAPESLQHRFKNSSETLASLRPELEGIGITRVADATRLDRLGIPVFSACRPSSLSNSLSFGKGLRSEDAIVGAVMEATELHFAEGAAFECLRSSGQEVPTMSGYDLLDGSPATAPLSRIHTAFVESVMRRCPEQYASTNGLASGSCWLEAIAHGLYELVERDSITFWANLPPSLQAARLLTPEAVEVTGSIVAELVGRLREHEVRTHLFDLTSDTGVPTVMAFLVDDTRESWRPLSVTTSSATHPSFRLAAVRAVTEACQKRVTVISGARDDIARGFYARSEPRTGLIEWLDSLTPIREEACVQDYAASNILDDVSETVTRLRRLADGIGEKLRISVFPLGHEAGVFHVVKVIASLLEEPRWQSGDIGGPMLERRMRNVLAGV